jgi:hypothetical protein
MADVCTQAPSVRATRLGHAILSRETRIKRRKTTKNEQGGFGRMKREVFEPTEVTGASHAIFLVRMAPHVFGRNPLLGYWGNLRGCGGVCHSSDCVALGV